MNIIYPPVLFLTLPKERPCFSLKYVSSFRSEVGCELDIREESVEHKVLINAVQTRVSSFQYI